jgi:hypothetical protein
MAEGVLELVVQHCGTYVEEGLHCRPGPRPAVNFASDPARVYIVRLPPLDRHPDMQVLGLFRTLMPVPEARSWKGSRRG